MKYLTNGFSLGMFRDPNMKPLPYTLTLDEFKKTLHNGGEWKSVIGHQELAECLTEITGEKVPFNRESIRLNYGDEILVVYLNGRLPEHPTTVEYTNKLKFSYVRFEKQSLTELKQTLDSIEVLMEE